MSKHVKGNTYRYIGPHSYLDQFDQPEQDLLLYNVGVAYSTDLFEDHIVLWYGAEHIDAVTRDMVEAGSFVVPLDEMDTMFTLLDTATPVQTNPRKFTNVGHH